MKRLSFLLVFLLSLSNGIAQNVGIASGSIVPDASSILEIRATDKGLLIPRVALTSILDVATITSPATSLLVYNTNTAGVSPNNVTPGYYYWTGSQWARIFSGAQSNDWTLVGNAGTVAGTNFIGTTDAVDWVVKTNNTEHVRVTSAGNVGIDNNAPSHKLTVQSGTISNTRLIGPGAFGSTARLNFGDGNYVYLDEDVDDALTIYGSGRTAMMGGFVGVNTTTPAYRFTIAGGGGIFGVDNTATFLARNAANTYESYLWPRWSDNVMYLNYGSAGFNIRNNSSVSTMFMTNGNYVGIGTTTPVSKLQVVGKTTISRDGSSECCSNDATLALADNPASTGRASISFHNSGEAEGTLGLIQNTINGVSSRRLRMYDNQSQGMGLELTGRLWYGNGYSRTETRDDAGLQGNVGAQSGFFETSNPSPASDWPTGASSWWHLIDCRHSNTANNYALQIAGSFFDQDLYYRKTNGSATTGWKRIVTWDQLILNTYGTNNQGVTGTTDCSVNTSAYTDVPQMSITFTPIHSTIYVSFTFSGYEQVSGMPQQWVDFRIVRDGVPVKGSNCTAGDYDDTRGVVTSFNGSLYLAMAVTPGVPTTIKAQWARDGLVVGTMYCNAATYPDFCHRSLIIID